MKIFENVESAVQSYARSFPKIFKRAVGARIEDIDGNSYIDFLAGAGTLNYGHNNPLLKQPLLDYISEDGIAHGLDMHTDAKGRFLRNFDALILKPRNLEYRLQFTGPTGTNAVEAALKIARKVTGRTNVVAFTNGFHGCTLGSVALTGNSHHRDGAGVSLNDVTRLPFDGYLGKDFDTTKLLEKMINDGSSGLDLPAAVIVEVVQGEGGLNVAGDRWLRRLEKICREHKIVLIVDDIQAGCGRTGSFFSFESSGIKPDIVTLSKSLSGFGLPFALTLITPDMDIWKPGEHNGTFRGNNHAFVTANAALEHYWKDDAFVHEIREKSELVEKRFNKMADQYGRSLFRVKGRGMMRGISCSDGELAAAICQKSFTKGLIVETSGADSEVVKCLCPLTIAIEDLKAGLDIIESSIREVLSSEEWRAAG